MPYRTPPHLANRLATVYLAGVFVLLLSCSPFPVPSGPTDPTESLSVHTPRIRLRWFTETEENTFGYFIDRSDLADGAFSRLNPEEPLPAAGTTAIPQQYTYYDLNVELERTYYYRVRCKNLDGSEEDVFRERVLPGVAKPLSEEEIEAILTRGIMFKEDNY